MIVFVLLQTVEQAPVILAPEQFAWFQKLLVQFKGSEAEVFCPSLQSQNSFVVLNTCWTQVKVFQSLVLRHPLCEGVQRIRCYPFPKHTFHGRNAMDLVFMLPVSATGQFSLPADKALLQYGRVLLYFQILVRGRLGKVKTLDCAFIKYFDVYNVPGKHHV